MSSLSSFAAVENRRTKQEQSQASLNYALQGGGRARLKRSTMITNNKRYKYE